ncbi:MAG: hypothetical protein HZC36_00460 [Armatimonadetes bacterium]|nr:hypothetical protein [Armatimonadota bacterium]
MPDRSDGQIPLLAKPQVTGAWIAGIFFLGLAVLALYGALFPFPGDKNSLGPFGFLFGTFFLLMASGALNEIIRSSGWAVRLDEDALVIFRRGREGSRIPWSTLRGMKYRGQTFFGRDYAHIDLLDDGGRVLLTVPVVRQSRAGKWEKLDLIKRIEDRMPPDANRLRWPWERASAAPKPPNAGLARVFLSVGVILGLPSFFALASVSKSFRTDVPPISILQPFVSMNGVLVLGGVTSVGAILGFLGLVGLARLRWPGAFETRYGDDTRPYFEFMAANAGRPLAVQLGPGRAYRYAAPRRHQAEADMLAGTMILMNAMLGVGVLTIAILWPEAKTPADVWAGWATAAIGILIAWYCEWGRRAANGLAKDLESRFVVTTSSVMVHRKDGTGLRCDLPRKWPKPKRSHSSFGSVLGRLRSGKEVVVVDPRFLVEADRNSLDRSVP